jgi:hypothetical protein
MKSIPSYMDSMCRVVPGDMWNAKWFLTVREILPCNVGSPEVWLRSPSQINKGVKFL